MTIKLQGNRYSTVLPVLFGFLLIFGAKANADKAPKPNIEGRPVYAIAGKIVVFPDGVEKPPKDYKGSIGARPIALIKFKEEIVGEVFAAPLKGVPAEEAKGMAGSAEKNEKMTLVKRETIKDDEDDVEVVTLKMDLNSKVGTPWLLHSLYFERGKSSTTFKLAASEKRFKSVLPYFEAMLLLEKAKDKDKEEPADKEMS